MLWARWLIYGIPAGLVLLTWWSADQSAESRRAQRNDIVIASEEGVVPGLNPFLPLSEVDRQVTELVHESLLRIGEDGELTGGLAKTWSWTQRTSFWFASELIARNAAGKLKKLTPEQWAQWRLTTAEPMGNEVRLQFSQAGPGAPMSILKELAEFGPLPVETVRIELKEEARPHHEYFLQNAVEASQVKSVWFDGSNAYELSISGETVRFYEELELYYRNHPALQAKITTLTKSPILNRPQLEMVLKEGVTFHDGTPVTGGDVEATVGLVNSQPWPVSSREALRLIAAWDTSAPGYVRVTFRELYGPALMAFTGLPILPARWIAEHQEAFSAGRPVFFTNPPTGAGWCLLESATTRAIFLARRDDPAGQRVHILLDQPTAAIRMGFAMKAVDIFWPRAGTVSALNLDQKVTLGSTAPRNRIMVMWNCRKAPLDDARVRAALGLAVDRPALMKEMVAGRGEIQEGIFQPGIWLANDLPVQPFDPEKARMMLYEAGWSKNDAGLLVRDGQPLRIDLLTVANSRERLHLAEMLQQAWKNLGITVTVTPVPWDELLDQRLPGRQFDGALIGLDFETTWDQFPFWHSSQGRRGLNYSGFTSASLDALLWALRSEFDPAQAKPLAQDVEAQIVAAHPYLPLFSGGTTLAVREDALPALKGSPLQGHFSLRRLLVESANK